MNKKIFLTTGSSNIDFSNMIRSLDKTNLSNMYDIKMQLGNSKYHPKNAKWFQYTDNIYEYYQWADLIVSHSGAGTLFELLKLKKKAISISNNKTIDNNELAEELDNNGYLIYLNYTQMDRLELVIKDVLNDKIFFKPYNFDDCYIENIIADFIG